MRSKSVTVPKEKAEAAARWARKTGVSHAMRADGTLKLWYVTPKLRASLSEAVGPISAAEKNFKG